MTTKTTKTVVIVCPGVELGMLQEDYDICNTEKRGDLFLVEILVTPYNDRSIKRMVRHAHNVRLDDGCSPWELYKNFEFKRIHGILIAVVGRCAGMKTSDMWRHSVVEGTKAVLNDYNIVHLTDELQFMLMLALREIAPFRRYQFL